MQVPVDSIVVIDSVFLYYVVTPFAFKVVKETDKTVEISRLKEDGEFHNIENTKTIRKSSIVAVLEKFEDFEPYKKMNDEVKARYDAYNDLNKEYEKQIKSIKDQFQGKNK